MSRMSFGESTEPLEGRWSIPMPTKVIAQVSAADWQQSMVFTKSIATPSSGADKIG